MLFFKKSCVSCSIFAACNLLYFDLTNCIYINKCKILGLNIISYNDLIKYFIKLR